MHESINVIRTQGFLIPKNNAVACMTSWRDIAHVLDIGTAKWVKPVQGYVLSVLQSLHEYVIIDFIDPKHV